jgi:hypothetical protein
METEWINGGVPRSLRVMGREIPVPQRRWTRVLLGATLVVGGFIPGPPGPLWVPVGLLLLSYDIPFLGQYRRRWLGETEAA